MNLKIISSSSTNIRTRGIFRAVLSAAVVLSLVFVVGCGDGDDDGKDPPGGNEIIGPKAGPLVGDWTYAEESGYQNRRKFLSFKSSGDLCESRYQKVDDFWVGGENCNSTWRADDKYIYDRYKGGKEESVEYTISGNTLTIFGCGEDCWEAALTKGGSKPSGTIRSGDPALVGTEWRMESSSNMDFYIPWFYVSIYFDDYHDDYVWYTSGNRLYMIGASETGCRTINRDGEIYQGDCALVTEETVEVTYTHDPGVSLRLVNTQRGIDDTWEYYDWRNDNAPPPSKRRVETGKRPSLFRPLSRLTPPSGR